MKKVYCIYCKAWVEVQELGQDFICPSCQKYINEQDGLKAYLKKENIDVNNEKGI